ncbi:energy-coupling factor transporter transmembrane component T family protein [Bifidobacterium aquikefiri]|uniref:energy-coupling factor transporter transmembrane component T family protein n=1 Tax=Bifidobacterium aquikefiri TaxID=1653207 RepID=UPI0039E8DDF5
MIAMYIPGRSLLHRCPAGWKLLALFATGAVLAYPDLPVWITGLLATACVLLYCFSELGLRICFRQLWTSRWIITFTFVAQVWFKPMQETAVITLRITAIVLFAALITLTTPLSEIFANVVRMLHPFQRFGVDTDRIGVAVSLGISVIPIISASMKTVHEASQARGVHAGILLGIQAWAVPLMVLVLKQADELADSLDARGI